ncbi:unnamed protein product [Clonostachys byssicola]|uniref:3-hydroxyisobutyrate dehydrogenase n=1 Tax=Clonostachys byssicola TaxID=160290 RepID=A0A9N9UBE8_9HYPO|nr:unnamed protein product [Clonostachys byssicola]
MSGQQGSLGFAGLGAMGFGTASNLLKAGFKVNGFDVNPIALAKFKELGGSTSTTAGEAGAGQSLFLIMVATPAQVDSVIFGADGVLKALSVGGVICLLSTLPPVYVLNLRSRLDVGRADIKLVDCPVSGGVIMLGGNKEDLDQVDPALQAISSPGRLFRCGPLGSASTVKMLNQHLAGVHIVAAAEVIAFAKALGLSSREAYGILTKSEATSWIMGDRGISMLNADWSPKSAVSIFTKDLGIVNDTADELSVPCPIASVARDAFLERAGRGFGRDDDASVVCNYEGITGKPVAEPKGQASLPSPPSESHGDVKVAFIIKDNDTELLSLATAAENKGLIPISETSNDLDTRLSELPQGSIVGVSSIESELLEKIKTQNAQLQVFDYQTYRASDSSALQIIFSTENENIVSAIKEVLPRQITSTRVSGPVGSASSMWLAIRLGSLVHLVAAAEVFSLAVAKGVSTELIYSLISGAAGSSDQFNQEFPKMMKRDFSVTSNINSTFTNVMKDLAILQKTMNKINYPGRLFGAAYQTFKSVNRTLEDKETSAVAVIDFWTPKSPTA